MIAAQQTRIAELAQIITKNTSIVDRYFNDNGIPTPSFDRDGPTKVIIPLNEVEAAAAHAAVKDATLELHQLMLGPYTMVFGPPSFNDYVSLGAIYKFKIAQSLGIEEEATYETLSERSGLDVRELRRIIRQAMTYRAFEEDLDTGKVRHTALSRLIAEQPAIQDAIGFRSLDLFPAAAKTVDALVKFGHAETALDTGFGLAHGGSMYEVFQSQPERGQRFANMMQEYIKVRPNVNMNGLLTDIPWEKIGKGATFVDVGGASGPVSIFLAQNLPDNKFVVQDFAEAVGHGRQNCPEGVRDRIQFMPHDINTVQTVKDADIYYLRAVVHNFPDAAYVKIIKNLVPALKKGAHLILNEPMNPAKNKMRTHQEHLHASNTDINMLVLFAARERDIAEHEALVKEADPRFVLRSAKVQEGGAMHVMDFEWTG